MKENLYKAFTSYIHLATNRLGGVNFTIKKVSKNKILIPAFNKSFWLRSVGEEIEASEEFHTLVSVLCGNPGQNYESKYSVSIPRSIIKNFFRRSKIYTQIVDNKPIDIDKEFELLNTFNKDKEIRTTTFKLIDDVHFPEKLVDFGTFKIQKFSQKELEKLTDNEINKNFYHYAVLEADKLQYYWFIVEESTEKKSGADLFTIGIDLEDFCRVSPSFPERSLQLLSLVDWGNFREPKSIEEDLGWIDFSIPLSFRINNDIFEYPFRSPDLSPLEFFPIPDSEGNEIGEAPQFNIHIDKNELEIIKNIIKKVQVLIDIDLSKSDWEFIDRAMGYLSKAFFCTDELEQLMWHINLQDYGWNEGDKIFGMGIDWAMHENDHLYYQCDWIDMKLYSSSSSSSSLSSSSSSKSSSSSSSKSSSSSLSVSVSSSSSSLSLSVSSSSSSKSSSSSVSVSSSSKSSSSSSSSSG